VRRLVIAVSVLAVVTGAILGWTRNGGEEPQWVVERVSRGPITASVTATGTVNPVTTVQVGTYVSGPIQTVAVDFNSPVRRGQLLARIDPRPFQVKLDDARAALENARARLEKDRAVAALKALNLDRARALRRDGIVSAGDLDLAVSEERQARAQLALDAADIASAEARLREAEVNLAYTDIVSPVDGIVVSRNVDVGQTVAASFQTPTLFLVAEDLTKMQVNASVSESDIGPVAGGQEATFTVDAYPADSFRGRVVQVRNAPVTVLNVVTYDVIIAFDNADLRLRPGMTANVRITTAHREDALRVPTRALRFRPPVSEGAVAATAPSPARGNRVWVPDGAHAAREAPVEVGIADDQFTEVRSGLAEGARVITAVKRALEAPVEGGSPFLPWRQSGKRVQR
jgi:HlyD family secretion protein